MFFLFGSADILARDDCWFSDGNLGSPRASILSAAAELEQLPWRRIYHTGVFDSASSEESDIVFRRCAEVVVPHRLDLNALHFVYCRSDAEKETLLQLLPQNLRDQYHNKILASARSDLFYRQHTFIETVRLSSDAAHVQFSPETRSPGPFHLRVGFRAASSPTSRDLPDFNLHAGHAWRIPVPAAPYTIELRLDGPLAYANAYKGIEIPF